MNTVGEAWPALTLMPRAALAYLDPGTQSYAATLLVTLLGGLGVFFGALVWPFKRFIGWVRQRFGKRVGLALLVAVPLLLLAGTGLAVYLFFFQTAPAAPGERMEAYDVADASYDRFERVVVLGMDGLEPTIMEEMMARGELPNFARLRDAGGYSPMHTTLPPESPVAWSAIATGCNPGTHGIFDFLHRDPTSYRLSLSITEANMDPKLLDRRETRFNTVRRAPGFWTIASEAGVPTTVIRFPAAFPPEPVNGRFLSGLGVPDLNRGLGRYRFYTTRASQPPRFKGLWHGGAWQDDAYASTYVGPKLSGATGRRDVELPVTVRRLASDRISLQIGDSETPELTVGQWSDYLHLRFKRSLGGSARAIVRAYLKALDPELELYVSTPEIDPADPYHSFTWPHEYAKELADAIGPYQTLGMSEDVNAMKDGVLSPAAFEQAMLHLFAERKKQFDYEFKRFDKGLFTFVFDASDRIQHMYWKARDPDHPAYDPAFTERFGHVIPDMYKRMDGVLGEVLARADEKTAVIACSDHGFTTLRTKFSVNSWLVQEGYMALRAGAEGGGREGFADVDWAHTRAYAAGFAALYINLKGREKQGIVQPGKDYDRLCRELVEKLEAVAYPVNRQSAIRKVYLAGDRYSGPHAGAGPDLVIGFRRGFRAEDASVLGGAPVQVWFDNRDPWCGDHLMDPAEVPGVFFANHRLTGGRTPRNVDVAPTILNCFGLRQGETFKTRYGKIDGRPLF